jgi:hypothetical protein
MGSPKNRKSWEIGMRRVNKIVDAERRAGLFVNTTGMYSDGVDILVFRNNELVRVYEATNWGKPEYHLQPDRADRYLRNLLKYPPSVQKIFVCSYENNLDAVGGRGYFEQHGIEVRVMGYQD